MGSGSSVDTQSSCKVGARVGRYTKGFKAQRSLHDRRAMHRKSKKLVTNPGLGAIGLSRMKERADPIQRLTKQVLVAERERNEAVMGSVRVWIAGQQAQDIWKAKYIKEKKKVGRLWRSYCAVKYPGMVSTVQQPPQLLWDAGITIFTCAQALRVWATNSSKSR
jgi:hypothetical protein